MNQHPVNQNRQPDYAGWHDVDVTEVQEVHQGFSILKCILEFIAKSRIPGIVAVLTLVVLSRIGCAFAEAKEVTNNGLFGALLVALMALTFGAIGLYLEFQHAKNSQEPPNNSTEPRVG